MLQSELEKARRHGLGGSAELTLQEPLARVLLEEGLMDDGTSHVVNHGDDDGLDVVLGVPGIVLEGVILWLCVSLRSLAPICSSG